MLKINGQRLAVRSDAIGARLTLEPITGVGMIGLKLGALPQGTQVLELELMLIGEDGSAFIRHRVPRDRQSRGDWRVSRDPHEVIL